MLYGSVLFLFFLAFLMAVFFFICFKHLMLQLSILIKENLLNVMNLDRIYLVLFASLYSVLNFHENNSRLIKINTFFFNVRCHASFFKR